MGEIYAAGSRLGTWRGFMLHTAWKCELCDPSPDEFMGFDLFHEHLLVRHDYSGVKIMIDDHIVYALDLVLQPGVSLHKQDHAPPPQIS